ncbi:hypothetical protein [Verminephrobacter eiseniae]|uniref:hypothetical protein n=1 Tax=Verminephrobacter eiseniae TaxID=364317 RepID=UPI0022380FDE|nr:hypothetical protein [Verminephrobacter eiseniae]MCW5230912.1 hypothetical protein [Verminephrobacter eiseniae]MCW5292645.1 hypothetical protein [Verminephrobacter eiseniae]MCW8187203.1 hypothetical protein [Verminephrobacter eiseniae]MCW8225624.1 hypothetical protein [Verminephrobacter eiseniae]MCW8236510.1 hypothetical protein [Verminephrobacter eiseniae]
MQYSPQQVFQLIRAVRWSTNSCIRLFWVRHAEGSRDALAQQLWTWIDKEAVIPLVLRTPGFKDANAVLADAMELFEANRGRIEPLASDAPERMTFLILSKEDFRLVNASSPIKLPDWFPVRPTTETYFSVNDLGQVAEIKPLNFPEARMDHVAEMLFDLEMAICDKLAEIYANDAGRVALCVDTLQPSGPRCVDAQDTLTLFSAHLAGTSDPRAYRPNAADKSKFLAARILKLVLGHPPKQLATAAEELSRNLHGSGAKALKPTFFAVMWRPANKMSVEATNWHAILVAFFQAYQLMNAHAHAGDFPAYAVSLQYANSLNLRQFLRDAKEFVELLQ